MSAHVLKINLDIQHNAALTALNAVQGSVGNIITQLKEIGQSISNNITNNLTSVASSFNNINTSVANLSTSIVRLGIAAQNINAPAIMDPQIIAMLTEADSIISKLNKDSLKDYNNYVSDVEKLASIQSDLKDRYENVAGVAERISIIEGNRVTASRKLLEFEEDINKQRQGIEKLVTGFLKNEAKLTFESKTQLNNFKKYVDLLKQADKMGLSAKQLGIDNGKSLKEIVDSAGEILGSVTKQETAWQKIDKWADSIKTKLWGLDALPIAQFFELISPIKMAQSALTLLNKAYEDNHTVNKLNLQTIQGSVKINQAYYDSVLTVAEGQEVLIAEAHKAVNALAEVSGGLKLSGADFNAAARDIAIFSRATGVSEGEVAKFRSSVEGSHTILDDLIIAQKMYNLTTKDTSSIVSFMNKNFAMMEGRLGGARIASDRISKSLSMVAGAARALKMDSEEAMDVVKKAFEKPIEYVLLLGSAISSTNPAEQFFEMSKTAANLSEQLKGVNPIARQAILEAYNLTETQLQSLTKTYNDQYAAIDAMKDGPEKIAAIDAANRKYTEGQDADKIAAEAREASIRGLNEAFDTMKTILFKVMEPLIPLINGFAALVNSPAGKVIGYIAVAFIALRVAVMATSFSVSTFKTVVGGLGTVLMKAGGLMGGFGAKISKMGESWASFGKVAGGGKVAGAGGGIGGTMKTIGDSFKGINWPQILMAAGMIALVGAALAVGIYLIGKALGEFPPNRMIEFVVVMTGLLGTMITLALIGPIAPVALWGAVMLAAVGIALGIGIAAIAGALWLMPDDVMDIALGLLTLCGTLALLGPAAALGAIGAALLIPTAALLLVAATTLSIVAWFDVWTEFPQKMQGFIDALSGITADKIQGLKDLATGIGEFSTSMAGVVAGGFFGLVSGNMSGKAEELAESMKILTTIPGLTMASKGIMQLGTGVKAFAEGLGMIDQSKGSVANLKNLIDEVNKMSAGKGVGVEVLNRTIHSLDKGNSEQKQQDSLGKIAAVLEEIRDIAKDQTNMKDIRALLDTYLPELVDSSGHSSASNQYT